VFLAEILAEKSKIGYRKYLGENMSHSNLLRISDRIRMEKSNNRKIDEQFIAQKKAEDTRYLAKVSHILVSMWEITKMIVKLNPGESLVINEHGELFKGKVKTEKLVKQKEKIPGRKNLEFDTEGLHEYLVSKSFVTSYGSSRKNAWENQVIKEPKYPDNPIVELAVEYLNELKPDQFIIRKITKLRGLEFNEIHMKDYPVALGMSGKTNKIRYYIYEGKEYWIKYD